MSDPCASAGCKIKDVRSSRIGDRYLCLKPQPLFFLWKDGLIYRLLTAPEPIAFVPVAYLTTILVVTDCSGIPLAVPEVIWSVLDDKEARENTFAKLRSSCILAYVAVDSPRRAGNCFRPFRQTRKSNEKQQENEAKIQSGPTISAVSLSMPWLAVFLAPDRALSKEIMDESRHIKNDEARLRKRSQ